MIFEYELGFITCQLFDDFYPQLVDNIIGNHADNPESPGGLPTVKLNTIATVDKLSIPQQVFESQMNVMKKAAVIRYIISRMVQ